LTQEGLALFCAWLRSRLETVQEAEGRERVMALLDGRERREQHLGLGIKPQASIPTVCLDIISLVASSCGYTRGEIERRVAQSCTAHVVPQRGLAERPPHRHPPRAQPVEPLQECYGSHPRLIPRCGTAQAPHREQGHPGGRTWEEKRPKRCTFLVMRGPPTYSSFRLLAMASPQPHCSSEVIDRTADERHC
jgi:hypothetical protein